MQAFYNYKTAIAKNHVNIGFTNDNLCFSYILISWERLYSIILMTMDIILKHAKQYIGQEVRINGWINNKRSSGKIHFLQIRDGSDFIQGVVVKDEVSPETFETSNTLTLESSVHITGVIKEEPRSPTGVELMVKDIKVIQLVAEDFPISKKDHGPDFLLNNRHLWLRSKRQWAIQRVRDTIIRATYDYLGEQSYIKIDAPILTPVSCEDTTELFEIDYFGEPAYLTQSGQLYIEAAIFAQGRVFDFGPVFRAEKSKTRRHLTEFWMMDAEAAFVDHKGNMKVQEGLVHAIVTAVLEKNEYELTILERDIDTLRKTLAPFPVITHKDAVKQLQAMGSDIKEDEDLGADDETMLTQKYETPIFVEKYPFKIKAFYMKKDPEDPTRALCSDLLAPEGYGEIIGGSEREDSYDELLKEIKAHNLNESDFAWYLDLRKYGSVPHSGFGYGLERLVTWICGIKHVRESIPFPRMISRKYP